MYIDKRPIRKEYKDANGNTKVELIPFDQLPYEDQRNWYYGICSESELERILNMQNGQDYLLRVRADSILGSTRLHRIVTHHSRQWEKNGLEWSLERFFTAYGFVEFKNNLPEDKREKLQNVSFANIFTNEANGLIFHSPFGVCATISHSLKYFLRFAGLAVYKFDEDMPFEVRLQSMRIAIRTMLGKEALDFDFDPRGTIPEGIMKKINFVFPQIETFIAGHEYCHYLNGDLDPKDVTLRGLMKPHFKDDEDYRKVNSYNTKQKHEFSADLCAMNFPLFSDEYYSIYYHHALLWFAMLAIYEAVEDTIFPTSGVQTHPGAKARYANIIENARRPIDFPEMEEYYCKTIPEEIDFWSDLMIQDVSENFELYEMYGSVYLAAPNTQWRGPELIDRVDY